MPDHEEKNIKKDKLTDKEKSFCYNYVFNPETRWNKAKSAIAAGYSEHSARNIAPVTYAKARIKSEICRLIKIYREPNKELEQRIIEERKKLAFSDILDYIDEEGNIKDLKKIDTSAIKKINKTPVKVNDKVVDTQYSIELYDKTKNLEGLASYLGMDKKIVDLNITDYTEQEEKLDEVRKRHNIDT